MSELPILQPASQPEPTENEPFYAELVAQIRRHLEAVLAVPGIDQFLSTKQMPAAFFTEFNAALACYDRLIDRVLEFDGSGAKIQCKKGCANCCVDLVRGITTAEIINIYHHVRPWPDARNLFLYHRDSAELFANILTGKLQPGEVSFGGRDPRIVESHIEYNALKRPCGFLDQQTGCCRIYPVRPVACRYFFSFDPAEMCTPAHEKYLVRKTRTVHLPESIHQLLIDIGHKLGFRPLNYLSGAFCGFAAEVMRAKMIEVL